MAVIKDDQINASITYVMLIFKLTLLSLPQKMAVMMALMKVCRMNSDWAYVKVE